MTEVKSIKDVNRESLADIVKAHLKSEDVEIVDVDLRQKFEIGKHGQSGFCSEMKGATVKYRTKDSKEDQEIHMLFKLPATNWVRHIIKMVCMAMHETKWYSEQLPALNNPNLNEFLPTCYYGYVEGTDQVANASGLCSFFCDAKRKAESGILMLEDLSRGPKTFSQVDRVEIPVSVGQFSAAFKFLGHFHGSWWQVLNGKAKSPDLTKEDIAAKYLPKTSKAVVRYRFKGLIKKTKAMLNNRQEQKYKDLANRLDKYDIAGSVERAFDLSSPFTTVVHGDFGLHNMLFREEEDGVTSLKVVDFGMMQRGHPIVDILGFTYLTTDKAFREQHYEACLRENYYNILTSYLGDKADDLTFEKLKDEIQAKKELVLAGRGDVIVSINCMKGKDMAAHSLSQINRLKKQHWKDVVAADKPDEADIVKQTRQRMLENIEELAQLGYI